MIQVFRVGRLTTGQPYMVMEYVEGRTVADLLAARGPLPAEDVVKIVAAVASALAAAHDCDIVHRDVRPANIFLSDRTGRPMLTDFGIAALMDTSGRTSTRLTAVGQRLGEVRYMSPEQLQGEPMTGQSDVYALGIVAFEMLTGRGPFDDRGLADAVTAHLREAPAPVASMRPDLDPGVASLIDRCLAKLPNHRPRASDIPPSLDAAGHPHPFPAPPATGLTGFLAELRRRRVYQVVVGYLAAGFVILQGAQLIMPVLPLPELTYNLLVAITLAGFPVAVVLSWVYDLTAGGVRRTDDDASVDTRRHRGLAWAGLGLSVVLAAILWWALTRS